MCGPVNRGRSSGRQRGRLRAGSSKPSADVLPCIAYIRVRKLPGLTPHRERNANSELLSPRFQCSPETSVSECASVSHPATLISTGSGLARGGFSPMHARQTLAGVVLAPATAPKPRPDRPRSEVSDSDGFINCCVATRSNNTTAGQEAWKAWR